MGMDGVEILMATEEAFGIEITDAEAGAVDTPRQLIELAEQKLGSSKPATCLSRTAFHRVRRGLLKVTDSQRPEIRPDTRLANVLAGPQLPHNWEGLRQVVGASRWPELIISRTILSGVWLASLVGGAAVILALGYFLGDQFRPRQSSTVLLLVLLTALALAWLSFSKLPLPKTNPPPMVATVGGLSRWLVTNEPELLTAHPTWSRERIGLKVREIVCDVLCCEGRYREDARFVEDLGVS